MYVYCVVCYHVIAAPYVVSVGHVFAFLYTLDDDSKRPMNYETLLLKVCPTSIYKLIKYCGNQSLDCQMLVKCFRDHQIGFKFHTDPRLFNPIEE